MDDWKCIEIVWPFCWIWVSPLDLIYFFNLFVLSSIRLAHSEITPVQKFGWQYLQRQKALGHPLSPHLNIYKPQLTWLISGGHRIAGCVMSGSKCFFNTNLINKILISALFVGVLLFGYGPYDFSDFIERVKSWQLPRPILVSAKFIVAWTIVFHTLNGIRFMVCLFFK